MLKNLSQSETPMDKIYGNIKKITGAKHSERLKGTIGGSIDLAETYDYCIRLKIKL